VTSKGGTTEAALASMANDGVKEAIVRAAQAASARGRELGDLLGKD
jgi:pyrroline-5-carboxylate reductase